MADAWSKCRIKELFHEFDERHFERKLGTETQLDFKPLTGTIFAQCRLGGRLIEIDLDPCKTHETQVDCSLLHEMVHAYEFLFPEAVAETQEARDRSEFYSTPAPAMLYGPHSARFFTKLFEVMRDRGHDLQTDFHLYFG